MTRLMRTESVGDSGGRLDRPAQDGAAGAAVELASEPAEELELEAGPAAGGAGETEPAEVAATESQEEALEREAQAEAARAEREELREAEAENRHHKKWFKKVRTWAKKAVNSVAHHTKKFFSAVKHRVKKFLKMDTSKIGGVKDTVEPEVVVVKRVMQPPVIPVTPAPMLDKVPHGGWTRKLGAWSLIYNGTDGWEGGTSECGELGTVIGGYTEERKRSTIKTVLKKKFLVASGSDAQVKLTVVPLGHWKNSRAWMKVNGKNCWTANFNGRQECGKKGQKVEGSLVKAEAHCDTISDTGFLDVEVYASSEDKEFSEPFAVQNVLVFAWQVPCDRSNCGTGATLKEPPPMCDGQCTSDICCDSGPMCSEDVCPADHMYKLEPVRHCASGGCSVSDCCDPRAKCDSNTCKPTEGWVRKDQVPTFCQKSSCNLTECCDPLPRCTADVCQGVMGKILTRNPPQFCVSKRCSLVECCETLPKCSPLDCDRTRGNVLRKNPPHFCEARECTSQECCRQLAQCSANICPTNAILKVAEDLPTFCGGTRCKWQECCDMLPKCSQKVCGAAELKHSPPTHCIHRNCTKVECCKVETEESNGFWPKLTMPWSNSNKGDKGDDRSGAEGRHFHCAAFALTLLSALLALAAPR